MAKKKITRSYIAFKFNPFLSSTVIPFSFLSGLLLRGRGLFVLIGYQSLTPGRAFRPFIRVIKFEIVGVTHIVGVCPTKILYDRTHCHSNHVSLCLSLQSNVNVNRSGLHQQITGKRNRSGHINR